LYFREREPQADACAQQVPIEQSSAYGANEPRDMVLQLNGKVAERASELHRIGGFRRGLAGFLAYLTDI
jgi:hypothetical protein